MYNSFIIANSFLAELQLPATIANGQRVNFQDIPQLRNVHTIAIEAISVTQLTKSPNGKTVIAAAGVTGLMLTLAVVESNTTTERIFNVPCFTLLAANNAGLVREFSRLKFNLVKSYITITDVTSLNANESICFNFYFHRK